MSGLFRYNTNSIRTPGGGGAGPGGSSGPSSSTPNSSCLSPFKTTPPLGLFGKSPGNNWLFNAESPHSFNMSSACGSPDKLKSVNEMERRLDSLEKENFNLRCRLFYQEETRSKPGQDLSKEIVDLKVQLASQKETIKEKTEAVVRAGKALTYMETTLKNNEKELCVLKERLAEMEKSMETSEKKDVSRGKSLDCSASSPEGVNLHDSCLSDVVENPLLKTLENENSFLKKEVHRLQECVSDMVKQLDHLMNDSPSKESSLMMNGNDIDECLIDLKEKNERMQTELCDTKITLELTAKNLECAKKQLLEEKKRGADLICENEELAEKLKKSEVGLRNATKIVEKVMSTSGGNNCKVSPIVGGEQQSDGAIDEDSLNSPTTGGGDGDILACEMRRVIREKNAEVLEHKSKMRGEGKSAQLIDRELSGKLEEVKRLTKALATHEQRSIGGLGNNSWGSARTTKTCDMTTLSNCSTGDRVGHESTIKRLEEELEDRRRNVEEAESRAVQMTELITVLRLRLEELAGFLKTLLQHKDILGFLCRERVTAIEKAVDRSLNFTNSMDVTCSNMTIGDITNVSKLFGEFSLTMDTTCGAEMLEPGNQVAVATVNTVEALKNEILTLRGELEKAYKKKEGDGRKERKSLPCRANNKSDSEWSGPDMNVSAQRIGIEMARDKAVLLSSSEEEDLLPAGCGGGKRSIMEKMLKFEREIEARDNKVLEVKLAMVELEASLRQEQVKGAETMKSLTLCKETNKLLDQQVGELKKKLSGAVVDLELAQSQLKAQEEEYKKEVEFQLKHQKEELTSKLEELRRKTTTEKEDMEKEMRSKLRELDDLKAMAERKEKEVCQLKLKLADCGNQLEKLKEKESQWCSDVMSGEEKAKKLRKTLDELTIQATRAAVERTKAMNERDKAVLERKEMEAKYDCLLEERIKLKDRLFDTDRLNTELCGQLKSVSAAVKSTKECDATSGYGSEETRPSSPERMMKEEVKGEKVGPHDCEQVDTENQELKRRLAHLKRTLEHTFNKLKMSNQMKEKVERDIQQQLIKTNNVLKIARGNIENRQS